MEVQKRKLEINLITIGTGVILFGVWTLVKFAVNFVLFGNELDEILDQNEMVIADIIICAVAVIDFLLRLYIGLSAKKEGNGKRTNSAYLVLTVVFTVLYALSVIAEFIAIFAVPEEVFALIVTLIIDITSMIFLIEVFSYASKLRKLRTTQINKGESAL